ncbi:cytochrome P450 [Favolaschia claudopus]|uniref:Cytochrome P450 n=1 Tax=Favolaschia claudopus TaxID=2862362 RepID=A0AAW0AC35_9AGAR
MTIAYIGNDFPEFYIPKNGTLPRVLLTVEESRHYPLSGPDALEEWASNSPIGYGYLRLGAEYRAFDMAMFHETHCLHALRIFIERADRLEPHVGHCLNYLRMFILCNPNLTLEPADVLTRDFERDRVGATHVCPNWEVLYREMEENWDEWKAPPMAVLSAITVYALLCGIVLYVARYIRQYLDATLRVSDLPGPPNPSILYGNFKKLASDPDLTDKWRDTYGRTFQFRGLFSIQELHTSDPKALNHIANNLAIYQKAPSSRYNVARLVGDGTLSAPDPCDRSHPRSCATPITYDTFFPFTLLLSSSWLASNATHQLRDLWNEKLFFSLADDDENQERREEDQHQHEEQFEKEKRIDVLPWLRRAALDSMGEAGLSYAFNALLGGEPSKFMKAMGQIFHAAGSKKSTFLVRSAQATFPILRYLPLLREVDVTGPRETLLGLAGEILGDRRRAVREGGGGSKDEEGEQGPRDCDILSSMIKTNDALPEGERLSDGELAAQIPALVMSGHDNDSIALAWTLYRLASSPPTQTKLRHELLSIPIDTDSPSYDQLNSLRYLENVVREGTRLDGAVGYVTRVVVVDDWLPLGGGEGVEDKKGRGGGGVKVSKGQKIHIPLRAVNVDRAIWGEDALLFRRLNAQFRPERWDDLPPTVQGNPSTYAHVFSFYAGGHSCIGYRYAIMEQKAILFSLLRAFEFLLPADGTAVVRTSENSLSRPIVEGERERGTQMPLVVRRFER